MDIHALLDWDGHGSPELHRQVDELFRVMGAELARAGSEQAGMDAATAAGRKALAGWPRSPVMPLTFAYLLLAFGLYREGFARLGRVWMGRGDRDLLATMPGATWSGADDPEQSLTLLAGKTLLVWADERVGDGDIILLARYLPLLADHGARVIVRCAPRLVPLMQRLRGVAAVVADGDPLPAYDLQVHCGTLPAAFGTTPETIPFPDGYLSADPERVAAWRDALAELPAGLKVGLVWASGCMDGRTIPFQALTPILNVPGVQIISLQVGEGTADLTGLPGADISGFLTDYGETAAAIEALDLVITVDTSVANLTGALGRPVWVVVAGWGEWRWGFQPGNRPWYRAARLFRQMTCDDWGVVEQVAKELGIVCGEGGTA